MFLYLVLDIYTFFRYQYFSIPGFDTKFRYRYFSVPDHGTYFKESILFDTQFRYSSQKSIPHLLLFNIFKFFEIWTGNFYMANYFFYQNQSRWLIYSTKLKMSFQTSTQRLKGEKLGIENNFGYRQFSILFFDTYSKYRYLLIPYFDTQFRNRYFSIPIFDIDTSY